MIRNKVPIVMLTDSLSLFDVITKATTTAEKRLMIDLEVVKCAYKEREVEKLGFIRAEHNPSDTLTKVVRSSILEEILKNAELSHPIEQWMERS